jgi:putative transcriptional regulator
MSNINTRSNKTAPMPRAESPTADQVRAARLSAGHSTAQAAALVHMDARSWRYYEQGARAMHPAMWELYRIKCVMGSGNA